MDITTFFSNLALVGVVGTMLSMGMRLRFGDFGRILEAPRALLTGLVGQMILLPAVAIALAVVLNLPPVIAVGIILLGACPGGTMSNSLSYIARGDMALSVSLTTVSSSIAFLTLPLVVMIGLSFLGAEAQHISIPFVDTAVRVFLTTIVPVVAGIIILSYLPRLSQAVVTPIFWSSFVAIIVPAAAMALRDLPAVVDEFGLYALTGVLLNVIMLVVGFALAVVLALPLRQVFTIVLEVGMQGFGLVVLVAMTIMNDPMLMLAGGSYLGFSILSGLAIAWIGRRMISSRGIIDGEQSDEMIAARA